MSARDEPSRACGTAQDVAGETGGVVSCTRCGGLMGWEPRAKIDYDYDADLPWRQDGYRCLTCGNYRDTVIDQNRVLTPRHVQP